MHLAICPLTVAVVHWAKERESSGKRKIKGVDLQESVGHKREGAKEKKRRETRERGNGGLLSGFDPSLTRLQDSPLALPRAAAVKESNPCPPLAWSSVVLHCCGGFLTPGFMTDGST